MSDCRADDKYNIQFRLRRIEGKYELAGQFINAQQTTVVGASPIIYDDVSCGNELGFDILALLRSTPY